MSRSWKCWNAAVHFHQRGSCSISPHSIIQLLSWKQFLPILGALIATYCWHWQVLFSSKCCLACAILFARCCQERRDKEQLDIFMLQTLSSEVVVKHCLTSADCPSQKLALSLRIDPLSVPRQETWLLLWFGEPVISAPFTGTMALTLLRCQLIPLMMHRHPRANANKPPPMLAPIIT